MAKRGRGLGELSEGGSPSSSKKSAGLAQTTSPSSGKWYPIEGVKSMKDLSLKEGEVRIVPTNIDSLTEFTNPEGAVSVVKYDDAVYCTSVGCSSCQIPLDKAQVLEPSEETGSDPRLSCNFCKATYNLKTGERVKTADSGGLLGGMMKGLFSKGESKPLPIYALGEKNGQVFINKGN
eukprot:CAMPEP_0178922388 /NCGR_PEP_ID=MMETSP0786-20121207/16123_1 /TAXON_ID=186022 /ORGANISM="Thalassionema frauenfeldii, Strain CCMP 1798" /LENGTH=177 /DNA_ID=CAMNT_0020596741 /DNA_START=144 /DNA_END=677 /DNA_ORIENTATION=-